MWWNTHRRTLLTISGGITNGCPIFNFSTYFQIINLCSMPKFLTIDTVIFMENDVVRSSLDFYNMILYDTSKTNMGELQCI